MKIKIARPCALNERGGRENNEDSIYPGKGKAAEAQRFFLVCDGMGGHENGELASRTVCSAFAAFLENRDVTRFDRAVFKQALEYAYAQLDKEDTNGGEYKMGTTLAFVCFHARGVFMAHIGDSRIYHIRRQGNRSSILYKSQDHSQVGELVRAGIITEEEAAVHPRRNIITRVMQPKQEKLVCAEICESDDIEAGDYFFLCTDGITESVSDELLCNITGRDIDDESKIKAIHQVCLKNSRDNFSAYLISITCVIC